MRKISGLLAVAAACVTAACLGAAPASAEEPGPSLHGFADISVKTDYITPRGLHVTSEGTTLQVLNGLVVDLPQDPQGLVTDVSFVAGTWSDFNPGYKPVNTRAFNEFDWFVGANAKLGKRLTLGVQYVEFISGQSAFTTEKNVELSAAFDDTGVFKPIAFHPYAKVFLATAGDSTVVVGKRGGTFDVELGAVPSLDLHPLVLSAPTWVTVGPESFWGNGGGNVGVFSTGLKLTYPLKTPPAMGHWSVYVGYQYYNLINDRLVLAQSILNPGKTDRSVNLIQAGVGLGF